MRSSALAALFALACSSQTGGSSTFPDAPYSAQTSSDGAYDIELRTAPSQPPVRGAIDALLTVTGTNGASTSHAIHVTPWMPAMGHGSSVTPIVTPRDGGGYVVTNLVLPMPGTWQLRVTIDGGEETVLPLDVQ